MEVDRAKRVVVMTGASAGLGRALCRAFASSGSAIALLEPDNHPRKNPGDRIRCRHM